jgi:hypothetical protein
MEVNTIRRTGTERTCPACGRANLLILPEGCCGNEFVWNTRCGTCGEWRWFHSREDASFVLAIKETACRRREMGGLSSEGTREAHAAFEATVDPCPCGGRFHVVMDVLNEPCLGCGRILKGSEISAGKGRAVVLLPLRVTNQTL